MKILLLHENALLAKPLQVVLNKYKYSVDLAKTTIEATYFVTTREYDAVIIDDSLKRINTKEILITIQKAKKTLPIAMLVAEKNSINAESIYGNNIDVFIKKSFTESEFVSIIRYLTRKERKTENTTIVVGNVTFNKSMYKLSTIFGSCPLSRKEFQLLEILFERPGIYTPTETIKSKVWETNTKEDSAGVWTYFSYIRTKLKKIKANIIIKSTRNLGYCIEVI